MNEKVNPDATSEELDDVEGHGMREVVAGIGAAAVLAGGAAAVANHDNDDARSSGGGSVASTQAAASVPDALAAESDSASLGSDQGGATFGGGTASMQTSASPVDMAGSATESIDTMRQSDVAKPGQQNAQKQGAQRQGIVQRTDDYVDEAIEDVRDVRDGAVDTAKQSADTARGTARDTARDTRDTARSADDTARQAVSDVTSAHIVQATTARAREAVAATITLAGDTARDALGRALTTVARIQPSAQAGADTRDSSGWVTISAGGKTLARAEVRDGQATLTWEAPDADVPVTVSYSGSDELKPATVTL